MEKQELKELFVNAKNANDVIAIFQANPGLEDKILEIGKNEGIDFSTSRELNDFELELIAGGLDLKKGVILTMSTLMVAGSLVGPLGQVTKAHAATPGQSQTKTEMVDNKDKKSDTNSDKTGDKTPSDSTGKTNSNTGTQQNNGGGTSESSQSITPPQQKETYSQVTNLKTSGAAAAAAAVESIAKWISKSGFSGVIGKGASEFIKNLLTIGEETQEQQTRNLIREQTQKLMKHIDETAEKLIQKSDENTDTIIDTIDDNSKTTNKKIDAQDPNKALQLLAKNFAYISKKISKDTVKDSFKYMSDRSQYNIAINKAFVDKTFKDIYSGDNDNTRSLFTTFENISKTIIGNNEENNHLNIMDLYKTSIEAKYNLHFDNESIQARKSYLEGVSKLYFCQYAYVKAFVQYESETCKRDFINEFLSTSVANKLPKDIFSNSDNMNWFDNFEKWVKENEECKNSSEVSNIWSKYWVKLKQVRQDLRELDKMHNDVLTQLKREDAGLKFEESKLDVFVSDGQAYTIGNVVNSDNIAARIAGQNDNQNITTQSSIDDITGMSGRINIQMRKNIAHIGGKSSVRSSRYTKQFRSDLNNWLQNTTFNSKTLREQMYLETPYNTKGKVKYVVDNSLFGKNRNDSYYKQMGAGLAYEKMHHGSIWVAENVKALNNKWKNSNEKHAVNRKQWVLMSHLYNAYGKIIGKPNFDGILVSYGKSSFQGQSGARLFHKKFWWGDRYPMFDHGSSDFYNGGCNAIESWRFDTNLRFISNGPKTQTVRQERELNYRYGTNNIIKSNNSKNLGIIKTVTDDYFKQKKSVMDKVGVDPR